MELRLAVSFMQKFSLNFKRILSWAAPNEPDSYRPIVLFYFDQQKTIMRRWVQYKMKLILTWYNVFESNIFTLW